VNGNAMRPRFGLTQSLHASSDPIFPTTSIVVAHHPRAASNLAWGQPEVQIPLYLRG
jgi:hypothetical protein